MRTTCTEKDLVELETKLGVEKRCTENGQKYLRRLIEDMRKDCKVRVQALRAEIARES